MNKIRQVHCNFELTSHDIESLVLVYQSIFNYPSLSLYYTLYGHSKFSNEINVNQIYQELHINIDTFQMLLYELEELMLIRTYQGPLGYIYVLNKPLTISEFLNHPTYGRLFSARNGVDRYKIFLNTYCEPFDYSNYKDISKSFNIKRLSVWDEKLEKGFSEKTSNTFRFDVNAFYNTTSNFYVPSILRTQEMTKVIEEMGTLYNINFADMRSYLYKCVNIQTHHFDRSKFINEIEKHYGNQKVESVENPYQLDPISFLKYLQKSDLVVQADKLLLASLSKEFGLTNEVINVLIEYVWHKNKFDLNKNYTQKIASVWKRRNIESLELAIEQISFMNQYSEKRTKQKVRINPTYKDEEVFSDEVDEELLAILEDEL